MSAASVRRLRDVRLTDAPEVGGKAASLGELLATGIRVPEGVVLTSATAGRTGNELRSLLRAAAADLGDGPFAVRSSGIAEDGAEHSFAGIYVSVLDVTVDELEAATERCLASARSARAAEYGHGGDGHLAVIVQRMVRPVAAGVILTADPVNGDRRACVVTAVRGIGERLVSGEAFGDEWVVRDGVATARRRPEGAVDRRQVVRLAAEARRIASARGTPQDIEWALDAAGTAWILQARPMTALPPEASWVAPAPGAYTRALRLGEWIPEPVTPLFESWLLPAMEERLHAQLRAWIGQRAPRPYHVVVNGWYFYSLNWLSGTSLARSLPGILARLVRSPRRVAGVIPPTVRYSVPLFEREWRDDLRPRYQAAVAEAEAHVETLPVQELPTLIDELAELAGESFASLVALAGAAYKMEMNLARFYRRHLAGSRGDSHLALLAGFEPPAVPGRHAVASLDWWQAPAPPAVASSRSADDHARLVAAREAAEAEAFRALAASPRRLRTFRRLLAETQHLVPLREAQVGELTIAWPAMRRAVLRIGEALTAEGVIGAPDDVFFLTQAEALTVLRGGPLRPAVDVAARQALRDEQARLVPPLLVGRVSRGLRWVWEELFPRLVGAVRSERAIVSGAPASPGRASGSVRVIRGPHQFNELLPGEVLVAPLTAPAWTPLFTRAAAVVTDVGSAASHASIIAREYGIPAVVGCGEATARLRTGMRVTVDGSTGNVEPG
jgi:rifampicin phosphotransferase